MLGQDIIFLFFWFVAKQFFGNRGWMSFLIVVCDCLHVQPTPPFADTFFGILTQEFI